MFEYILILIVISIGFSLFGAFVTPNAGEDVMLANIVNKTAPQNWVLKLYKSNTTPAEGDTAATYTEADFTGYGAITLTGASWSIANPTASYAQQTFTSSAGSQNQSVYGYFCVGLSDTTIRIAEKFADGPYVIVNNGDVIKVTPNVSLD